ncbi:MAG: elongation factor P maturation arginine rhamnosyltransferase EarP [Rhizobiales bacterium]|nr:elongation factor P maturation arginine rhamnosyltransferase EarP [Rhizobacter sp.]
MQALRWDVFCRVVDNFGDIGVCWRLAADLADRGQHVRLWVDDASALAWMAPRGAAGVEVLAWPMPDAAAHPGDIVIEAFGCELPDAFVQRMAQAARVPLWINLEYLSAEDFVERSHRLMSPQSRGVGASLCKWFFYPGFTPRTGGLLREVDLALRLQSFEAPTWLAAHGVHALAGEQIVGLFCYEQTALPALLDQLARRPTLLLATAGHAARQVVDLLGPTLQRGQLRAVLLPALSQLDYDHLLWASDLNFVRGEDSFVRAQWAGKPFVWQIYPQHDDAHLTKLEAFLARFGAGADLGAFWHAWNAGGQTLPPLPAEEAWRRHCVIWRSGLLTQSDLTTQLLGFAAESR